MTTSSISRLTLPAVISLAGIAITQAWYMKTATKSSGQRNAGAALAVLTAKNDVVERRPSTRIIWESLGQGEQLFGGEAVRTSSTASGKITFIKSGMTIGLEPDSLVIIEESNGSLQLNLVNGGVFVKNEGSPGAKGDKSKGESQPVLKAGNKKIELSSAKASEMNLSVSESGAANIQVTKGDIKVADKSGAAETIAEGKSKSISTNAAAPALMDVKGPRSGASIPLTGLGDKLNLTWSGIPDGAIVFFESGTSRDTLVRSAAGVPSNLKNLSMPVKSGDFFWRLVAVKDGKVVAEGPTTFNQGVVLEAPKLLDNANNDKIVVKQGGATPEVHLSWTRPQNAEDVTVYLAKDAAFKEIVASKVFTTETEWTVQVKEDGNYFWRTAVRWPGVEKSMFSNPGTFAVTKQKDVPTPTPDTPLDGAVFTKPVVDANGIVLSWNGQQGTDSYNLRIERQTDATFKTVLTKDIPNRQFRISNVPPGTYQWTVAAKVGNDVSKASAPLKFKVIDLERLTLKNPDFTQKPLVFEGENTSFTVELNKLPATTARLRFRVASVDSDLKSAPWQNATPNKPIPFKLPKSGSYKMIAEALDQADKPVGMTDTISFEAKEPDLLPAPQLLTGKQNLKSGGSGDITLKWKPIPGAVRYLVEINGPKTKFRKELPQTTLNMNNLFPGEHTLTLRAIDKIGRMGAISDGVKISVPDVSNIAAPTSKGIKIR